MNRKKIENVLSKILSEVKLSDAELKGLNIILRNFLEQLEKSLKKSKVKAEVFLGGSFAKKTIVRKDVYDADVFLRFNKSYKDNEISEMTRKILKDFKKKEVKGSRNYFQIQLNKNLVVEVIPVLKVKNPKEAKNVTDLSYSHVNYIKKKMKSPKLLDEARIAKAFCYANNVYGAESYIRGFSGYALELLILRYRGFLNFIKAMEKINPEKEKEIIDIEKQFKNKKLVLIDVNESKLKSPVILIDPTWKNRNVLAALSEETFEKFRKICRDFLKKPSLDFFREKKIDFEKERIKSKNKEFAIIEIKTNKQKGDIAGTKLLKFFNHLEKEVEKYFNVKSRDFEYSGSDFGQGFFTAEKKKKIIKRGPSVKMKKSVQKFKKANKEIFTKKGRIYAREKADFDLKKFLENWKKKYKKRLKEMSITEIRVY